MPLILCNLCIELRLSAEHLAVVKIIQRDQFRISEPNAQTLWTRAEHLAAVEIMQLKHMIILQNKIDLIDEAKATNQNDAIQVLALCPRRRHTMEIPYPISRNPAGSC